MTAPAARREAAGVVIERHGLSERHACRLVGVSRSGYRAPPRPDRNAWLRVRLKELAEAPDSVRCATPVRLAASGGSCDQPQTGDPDTVRRA